MSAINTSFNTAMKNFMLNQWRGQANIVVVAKEGAIFIASGSASFSAASNGRIQLSSNITINIPSDDTYTVNVLELKVGGINGTDQMAWVINPGITYTAGGTLVITQIDIEIDN